MFCKFHNRPFVPCRYSISLPSKFSLLFPHDLYIPGENGVCLHTQLPFKTYELFSPHVQTCGRSVLDPNDPQQRAEHEAQCVERHRRVAQRTAAGDLECGICLEKVMQKQVRLAFTQEMLSSQMHIDYEQIQCIHNHSTNSVFKRYRSYRWNETT